MLYWVSCPGNADPKTHEIGTPKTAAKSNSGRACACATRKVTFGSAAAGGGRPPPAPLGPATVPMSFARRLRRRHTERAALPPALLRVVATAGVTLGLTEEQVHAGVGAIRGEQPHTETSDALLARTLALCVLSGNPPRDLEALQTELEARNGAGFSRRVAAMGTPTASLPDAIFAKVRRILAAALVAMLMLLAPSGAKAAERSASEPPVARIRYSRVNFGRRRRHGYSNPRGWTRSRKNCGISRRPSRSRSSSVIGSAPGRAKNFGAGRNSRSSWFGGGGVSASATCRKTSRSSRSNARTAASSAPVGLSLALCLVGCGAAVEGTTAELE